MSDTEEIKMNDYLEALERRADELEVFSNCQRQAKEYIAKEGTQKLVDELRKARADHRRMKVGTINILVLLEHIDRLEAELAKEIIFLD